MAMILTGVFAAVLHWRKKLFEARWFHWWCLALTPAGFIAVLAGWFVTEVGRQPYIVYGVLLTADAASPVSGVQVGLSLLAFVIVYLVVFGAGVYYIGRLILKGPGEKTQDAYGTHGVEKPPIVTDLVSESGGEHV